MFNRSKFILKNNVSKRYFFDIFKKDVTGNSPNEITTQTCISKEDNAKNNSNNMQNNFVTIEELFNTNNITEIHYYKNNYRPYHRINIEYTHYNFKSEVKYDANTPEELIRKLRYHFETLNKK